MPTKADFSPNGTKYAGQYENDRNAENRELYSAILREVFGVKDVICGHHLVYQLEEKRADGFTYTFVEEVPSADALIFDHDIASKLWPEDYLAKLAALAVEPISTRDALLSKFYYEGRQ